jgi:general secretion pathway protein J
MMGARLPFPNGFTLVEMMVALAIFSLISVSGVALLQSASDTQLAVKDRLAELGGDARMVALLEADLAQAIARPVRSSVAGDAPAFAANGGEVPGQLFAFTRGGWSNLDNAPRGEVQRVAWALDKGVLKRTGWSSADGGVQNEAILLSDVVTAVVQFRAADGSWRSDWDASNPNAMPRAVELVVTQQNMPPVRMLFMVGAAQPAKPTLETNDNDGA